MNLAISEKLWFGLLRGFFHLLERPSLIRDSLYIQCDSKLLCDNISKKTISGRYIYIYIELVSYERAFLILLADHRLGE